MHAGHADALVFFGATGDLAAKQIFPALQALGRHGTLEIPIIGVAGRTWSDAQLRDYAHESLAAHGGVDAAAFATLATRLQYVGGDYHDRTTFARLREALGSATRPLYYLAIPPALFTTVIEGLTQASLTRGARVVVEKPFGRDLASAQALNALLLHAFPEDAIFRIDHFLGKEAVQNLLYFRFANTFLEPIWNRLHIAAVHITMAEQFGVEGRGSFYDAIGAIRDVVQNHLLQVTALLAMDAPVGAGPQALRHATGRVLEAMRPIDVGDVVRGQFRGYRVEAGVAPASPVETFAAARLMIDSWRWSGVPFYIRTGKHLPLTVTEVLVTARRPPPLVFGSDAGAPANAWRFRLSPDHAIALNVRVKRSGEAFAGDAVELIAHQHPGDELLPYERLLGDALRGDPTLFVGEDAVEAEWRVVAPILDAGTPLHVYEPGTWGPPEAESLSALDGGWHNPLPADAPG